MSPNFGEIDIARLTFPAIMRIDYVRIYQRKDQINIGCDPEAFPTMSYINESVGPLFFPLRYVPLTEHTAAEGILKRTPITI
jgi:Beta-glucan synthesis-associated protein SKN1/KRE6/Sbg1